MIDDENDEKLEELEKFVENFKKNEDTFDKEMQMKEDKIRDLQETTLSKGFDHAGKLTKTGGFNS